MADFVFRPVGVIHTPFRVKEGIPIQGGLAPETRGRVEVFREYEAGLNGLEGFSHIILLYAFHMSDGFSLKQKPFLDDVEHGVFAIRSPRRPNPVGMTIVGLEDVDGNMLHVSGVDMLDGTPLLDIKPYVPEFDERKKARIGWLEERIGGGRKTADNRFS